MAFSCDVTLFVASVSSKKQPTQAEQILTANQKFLIGPKMIYFGVHHFVWGHLAICKDVDLYF